LLRGVKEAYGFLVHHLNLYTSFLVFRIGANALVSSIYFVFGWFVGLSLMALEMEMGNFVWVELVVLHALIAYVGLVLDGFVLVYFLDERAGKKKAKKHKSVDA